MPRPCTKERNVQDCGCTYGSCARKGLCCDCIAFHRANGEVPGCLFPPDAEKTYDRSIGAFVKAHSGRRTGEPENR
jgi:hypothetical protein